MQKIEQIEDPATLTVQQLETITRQQEGVESENVEEYRPGGYMPIVIGQGIGPGDKYCIIRKLGWGNFSTVWLCSKSTSRHLEYFALKIVKGTATYKNAALDEIELLNCVKKKDPNNVGYNKIILLQEYFNELSFNGVHICLTFEIMGPSLLDLLITSRYHGIDPYGVKTIVKQVLEGLVFLHDVCHIIHADLKPENILISASDSYIRNLVKYVHRYEELGVQMPKSYVSAVKWRQYKTMNDKPSFSRAEYSPDIKLQPSTQDSTSSIVKYINRFGLSEEIRKVDVSIGLKCKHEIPHDEPNCSHVNCKFNPNTPSSSKKNEDSIKSSALFIDPNIKIKIADLGNACWEHKHFSARIQTVNYRALEVILEADYSFAADLWSVGCLAFELSTGDYLFDVQQYSPIVPSSEEHLGLIWELLDGIPQYIALNGKESSRYFNSAGLLKHVKMDAMSIWKVEDILVDKYGWNRVDANTFADFILTLIDPDPTLRATASSALQHPWLKEVTGSH